MKKLNIFIAAILIMAVVIVSPSAMAAGAESQTINSETANELLETSGADDMGVTYRTHIQNNGWETTWAANGIKSGTEGQSLRLEAIEINLTGANLPTGGQIEYRTHVQNKGWESSWATNGNSAGTEGQSLRLEAIEIRLVNLPGYSVQYRVHVQNQGWETNWAADGDRAGTAGQSLRLEAIEIRLVKTVSAPEGLTAKAGRQSISLFWNGIEGADSYTIYQATSIDGEYTEVATGITTADYEVSNREDGNRYYYKIKARTGGVDSSLSEAATAIASVDDQGNVFLGNQLLISNESTDIETAQSTGALTPATGVMEAAKQNQNDFGIDAVIPFEPAEGQQPIDSNDPAVLKTSQVAELNSTHDFHTYNFETDILEQTHARLAYNGTHVQIWVDANAAKMVLTDADVQSMGEEFDNTIYPLVTENFYTESDVNGDGKIAILCFDIQDGYAVSGDLYHYGYFYPGDFFDEEESNKMEVIYADTYPTMGNDVNNPEVSNIYVGLAHEFQHMVNCNRNVIEEESGVMEVWLNEALSEAAQYRCQVLAKQAGQKYSDYHTGRILDYNESEAIKTGRSLLDFNSNNGDIWANYALSHLFTEYLRTQVDGALGTGNEVKVFKEIIEDPGNGAEAVEHVIQKYIDPNLTFGEFMTNFRAAMVLKADTGYFGFNGEEAFDGISTPLYSGGTTNLDGGGAILTTIDAPFTIPGDQGRDISYLGIFR